MQHRERNAMAESLPAGIRERTMRSVWVARKKSFSKRAGIIAIAIASLMWAATGFDGGLMLLLFPALGLLVFVGIILQWLLDSTNYADCTQCKAVRKPHEIREDLANPRERQCAMCGAPEPSA